jgi:hypothetical protein
VARRARVCNAASRDRSGTGDFDNWAARPCVRGSRAIPGSIAEEDVLRFNERDHLFRSSHLLMPTTDGVCRWPDRRTSRCIPSRDHQNAKVNRTSPAAAKVNPVGVGAANLKRYSWPPPPIAGNSSPGVERCMSFFTNPGSAFIYVHERKLWRIKKSLRNTWT